MMTISRFLIALIGTAVIAIPAISQDAFSHWPLDLRINGTVLACGNADDLDALSESIRPSESEGVVRVLADSGTTPEQRISYATMFGNATDYRIVNRSKQDAFGTLVELLQEGDIVLWHCPDRLDSESAAAVAEMQDELSSFLERGKTFGVVGPNVDLLGVGGQRDQDDVDEGLGLLPDCVVQVGELSEMKDGIMKIISARPRSVGVSIAPETCLRLQGRVVSVAGDGSATFLLPPRRPDGEGTSQTIARRGSLRRSANDYLIDLTQWRRRAIDLTLPAFPPESPETPYVKDGTLVIVGGGGMPRGLMRRFVEIAGGPKDAKLVYVPCSESAEISGEPSTVRQWKAMGVRNATFIHTKDRNKANSDESLLAPLREATGIWFGGGRQWNFADSYYGTEAQKLMQEVVQRGGVVGGSSAGASVQARFLARATPIENFRILAPGYERGGLGFLSGVAIDQHFSQRRRQKDMTQLVNKYPQMLGIGIDEATALIVQESTATVVGNGDVYFYDRSEKVVSDPDYVHLPAGGVYDLDKREIIRRPEDENENQKSSDSKQETPDDEK